MNKIFVTEQSIKKNPNPDLILSVLHNGNWYPVTWIKINKKGKKGVEK